MREVIFIPAAQLKFLNPADAEDGVFTGYASVFHRVDSHGDVVMPGAFVKSLSNGRLPTMYVNHEQHNPFVVARPVGRWQEIIEDEHGLRVKGVIGALDCEIGRSTRAQIRDGLLPGLSIAYTVPPGGSVTLKGAKDEPSRRQLNEIELFSIDVVDQPSNAAALITSIKSIFPVATDPTGAAEALEECLRLVDGTTQGSDSPNLEERRTIREQLTRAHRCITGKSAIKPVTIREFETFLREQASFTNSEARAIAERGFKATAPRDGDGTATKEAIREIAGAFKDFSLPSF